MKQDRFLVGILIFIGVLVVVALALFFIRQDNQVYVADDTPDNIVRNYALALQKQDFQRAYTYLADNRWQTNLRCLPARIPDEPVECFQQCPPGWKCPIHQQRRGHSRPDHPL